MRAAENVIGKTVRQLEFFIPCDNKHLPEVNDQSSNLVSGGRISLGGPYDTQCHIERSGVATESKDLDRDVSTALDMTTIPHRYTAALGLHVGPVTRRV